MDTLQELQRWYHSQCDGDWEHGYGIEIGTLDNPGWRVVIHLEDTELSDQPFAEVQRSGHETDWIYCCVRDGKWEGFSGPFLLEEVLRTFLTWATERPTA